MQRLLAISGLLFCLLISNGTKAQSVLPVRWIDLVGGVVSGDTLRKTAVEGWGNAGAVSSHYLESNTDGWFEYAVVDAVNRKAFGFADLNSNDFPATIRYRYSFGADGRAYMYDNATELGSTAIVSGDVLRLERSGTNMLFKKNGTVLFTISNCLMSSLFVDASLYTANAKLTGMRASFGDSVHPVLKWTGVKGFQISEDNLFRTLKYSSGYLDCGAVSTSVLSANTDGWIEGIASETDKRRIIGFSRNATYTDASGVAYGIQFNTGGAYSILENGGTVLNLGTYTTNTIARISREGNAIKYYVNDVLRHTTTLSTSNEQLYVHVGFHHIYATLKNVYASFSIGQGTIPDHIEYQAVKDFYDSLGGQGWSTKTNWATTWPRHLYNTQFNNWYGLTVQSGDVTKINMAANNLTGFIPTSIGNLKKVNYLRLYNNQIGGKIPSTLGNLTALTFVHLGANNLSGSIPESLGNLINVTWLALYRNFNLSGSLPTPFYNLTKLTDLYIYDTQISGSLSEQIGSFTKLVHFWGYRNKWTGVMPSSLGNIATLQNLYLYSNEFSGAIPSNWQNLTNLKNLWIHYQPQLTGEFPAWIGSLTKLESLSIGDSDLHGTLPASIGTLTNLTRLWIFNLDLEGSITTEWSNLNKLTVLNISEMPKVGGAIPAGLVNQSTLKDMDFSDCSFTSFPDITSRTDKSTLIIDIKNNQLPFTDIERYFTASNTHVFDSLFYSGQRLPEADSVQATAANAELRIEALDGGTHGVYLWEKLIGSTWTNIGAENESTVANIFSISNATAQHAGTYRYTVTNAWMPGYSYSSGPIDIIITDAIDTSPVKALYNGLITSVRWRTSAPVNSSDTYTGMYVYSYDDKYQIADARWGEPTFNPATGNRYTLSGNTYRLTGMSYDPNGNIQTLKRYDQNALIKNDFLYHYQANTNKLQDVDNYTQSSNANGHGYTYNALGQLTDEDQLNEEMDKYIEYDVKGKVVRVYTKVEQPQAPTETGGPPGGGGDPGPGEPVAEDVPDGYSLRIEYLYDDRGFRLAKVNHETNLTTWYIRDASGNVLSIYEQEGKPGQTDTENTNGLNPTEVPIYASGKIGTHYPLQEGATTYEITDHLGNVRALIRDQQITYKATMEDNGLATLSNPRVQELQLFENITQTVETNWLMNHTEPIAGIEESPDKAVMLHWISGLQGWDAQDKSVGPSIALQVHAGDEVNLETWARYQHNAENSYGQNLTSFLLSQFMGSTFVGAKGLEGLTSTQIGTLFENALSSLLANPDDATQPRAYLNYIVFNKDLVSIKSDRVQVSEYAAFDENNIYPGEFEHLTFAEPVTIPEDGYIYVWLSNQSEATTVWFDDLTVTRSTPLMVTQATDYGVWGEVLREQKTDESLYRYGYQGQFAEKDKETGWNHFELREYDPVIGRWLVPDPAGQYPSPYVSFGNNPISRMDPDGGTDGDPNDPTPFSVLFSAYSYARHTQAREQKLTDANASFGSILMNLGAGAWQGLGSTASWLKGMVTLDDGSWSSTIAGFKSFGDRSTNSNAKAAWAIGILEYGLSVPNMSANELAFDVGLGIEKIGEGWIFGQASSLRIMPVRASGGALSGFSVSRGWGWGAKPRFDFHPLKHPSRKTYSLTLPKWLRNGTLPIPHYHRGRGNALKIHRPWEIKPNGTFWSRF